MCIIIFYSTNADLYIGKKELERNTWSRIMAPCLHSWHLTRNLAANNPSHFLQNTKYWLTGLGGAIENKTQCIYTWNILHIFHRKALVLILYIASLKNTFQLIKEITIMMYNLIITIIFKTIHNSLKSRKYSF